MTEDRDSQPQTPIVGIGASAGGLDALKQFFSVTPDDTGLAYVVVVHLTPEQPSLLADLLQPLIGMPVQQVSAHLPVEPNNVYVIPPGSNLSTIDSHLRLSELEAQRRERAPIDHFFDTLAQTHGEHCVGVVLSGTGGDGAIGISMIKERGGLTIAQEPTEAEFDGMPQSAIATGLIDLVLPVREMPAQIQRFLRTRPRLVHSSEHAGRYLRLPGGEPSANVFKLVREELRIELRAALDRAAERNEPVRTEPLALDLDGEPRRVVLLVRPSSDASLSGLCLVIFDEMDPEVPGPPQQLGVPAEERSELEHTKERLRTVIEQHETSQEEMKAANEELQSANEELRSTLEELETSKEELQFFDLFTQGPHDPAHAPSGLGLGLTLVRRIVVLHGGSIQAHSAGPGQGSEFILRLPLAREQAESAAVPGPAPETAAAAGEPARRRVLIVDDVPDIAYSLALALELAGHEPRQAHSGREALEIVDGFAPDVAILDIGLPDMDGYALARALRERPTAADALLIAVSGYGQQGDRDKSRAAGIDHHLAKPADLKEPLALIQQPEAA